MLVFPFFERKCYATSYHQEGTSWLDHCRGQNIQDSQCD